MKRAGIIACVLVVAFAAAAFAGEKPFIGISIKAVTPDEDGFPGGCKGGLRITGVKDESPAAEAGLREGDVILRIDKFRTPTYDALSEAIKHFKPGDRVELVILRGDALEEVPLALGGVGAPEKTDREKRVRDLREEIDGIAEESGKLRRRWRELMAAGREEEAAAYIEKLEELEKRLKAAREKYEDLAGDGGREKRVRGIVERLRKKVARTIEDAEELIRKGAFEDAEDFLGRLDELVEWGGERARELPAETRKELLRLLREAEEFIEGAEKTIERRRGGKKTGREENLRGEIARLRREVEGLKKDMHEINRKLEEVLRILKRE